MSNTATVLRSVPTNAEAIMSKYKGICDMIKELEESKRDLRDALIQTVAATGESVLEVGGFKATLSEYSRESFSYANARQVLSKSVIAKLQPFVSVSQEVRLSVKATGKG
jgi:hypothetical protein